MGIHSLKKKMNATASAGYGSLKCSLIFVAVLEFLILIWWFVATFTMPTGNANWVVPIMGALYLMMGVAISFIASSEDFNKLCGRPWN